MWKYNLVALCWAACVCLRGSVSAGKLISEYSITPSRQLAYYHYPAPSRSLQLPPNYQTQRQRFQPSQRAYATASGYQGTNYREEQTSKVAGPLKTAITQQFSSPALEQAAFTMALTSQGYRFGAIPQTPSSSPAASQPQTPLQSQGRSAGPSAAAAAAASPAAAAPAIISSPDAYSLNVKLPLPLGSAPIKLGPLPLQAGAPYVSIPRGLTSYGTPHPLRR